MALIAIAVLPLLCAYFQAYERLNAFVAEHEAWQLDELIITLLCSGLAAGILLIRRSRALRLEMARRQIAVDRAAELSGQLQSRNLAEHRLLREAVRTKEQRLESILATAQQAIVTIDRHGVVSGWNRHAELTFGWRASEVVGQCMSRFIVPPALRASHDAGLARFMESRTARVIGTRIEVTAQRRNGDIFPIELALSATNIGEDWQFTALIQDISERRAQTELFENAFDHAPIGMAVVALDGRLLKLNSAFCQLIGYSIAEATKLDFQAITHPDDLAADLLLLADLIAGKLPSYQLEKRYIRKSGRVMWARLSVSMVVGDDGAPKHLIAQVQDLSAQRESEARYRLLADSASDMVGLYSIAGRCSYMSPSSEKILGFLPEELIGRSVFGFMPPARHEAMVTAMAQLKTEPAGATMTHLTWLRHKAGHLLPIEFVARIVMSDDDEPQIVSACRDVTARVEAQAALEKSNLELTQAYQAAERSAAQLNDAQALFKGIFDSSSDLNFVCDVVDGAYPMNTMNAAAEVAFGTTAAEARGKSLEMLFTPDVAARMIDYISEAMASKQAGRTMRGLTVSRHGGTFDIRLVPLCDNSGAVHQVFVGKRDISDLKRAEQAAVQANVLMSAAGKIAHMGFCSYDLTTQKMIWSEELWTILGFDSACDAPTIENLTSRRHPDDSARAIQTLAGAIANGADDYESNYRLLLPNGMTRHVMTRGTIRRERGVAVSIFGVMLDISALKQAEEKARESDLRYRLMAENSSDIIVTSDLEGHTTFVSPSSEAITGYTPEDRLGALPGDITHPDDLDGLRKAFRALWAGATGKCVRWRAWHKTEERWVWLESSPALLRDPVSNAPTGYLDVIRDVTANKEQEDALSAATLAAEEAMHSKERFLANMSHELRTPLNSIIGFSRLLDQSVGLDAEDQRRIRMVHRAGVALHAVIDNVLDFSKLEADKLALVCASFDVAALVTGTASMMEPQAAARDVVLNVNVDPAIPHRLVGDHGRLRQILLNLLSNAIKFTQNGAVTTNVLKVGGDDETARLRVEVVDTGGGISPDKIENLFNRFVQASASVALRYGGTGLGLAISRQLVTLMGGEIGVLSEVGVGSTFWFELALPVASPTAIGHDQPTAPQLSLIGKRILVVDDVDLNRELMLAMLAKYGCAVELAENGAEALTAVEVAGFDLILMDCQMPVMDGFAATRALRCQTGPTASLPIVALTASAQPEHLARCREAGMDDHLTKPLEPGALEEVLRRYLGHAPARPAGTDQMSPLVADKADPRPDAGTEDPAPPAGARSSLKQRYAARRDAMIEKIDTTLCRGHFTDAEISELAAMAHNLAGTAGMFGEAALGDAAAALDSGLKLWPVDERACKLRQYAEEVHRIVGCVGSS
ncbi:PAS domain S-box protein [Sphingomonas qilianensis]|uniref:PAS domain S-box protein n=1 Tax=Sphingomonas qilianensis TaxID=1736690 RepID=UPI0036D39C0D